MTVGAGEEEVLSRPEIEKMIEQSQKNMRAIVDTLVASISSVFNGTHGAAITQLQNQINLTNEAVNGLTAGNIHTTMTNMFHQMIQHEATTARNAIQLILNQLNAQLLDTTVRCQGLEESRNDMNAQLLGFAEQLTSLGVTTGQLRRELDVVKKSSMVHKGYTTRMVNYRSKMEGINTEDEKLKKELVESIDNIPARASVITLLLGGYITVQSSKPDPEFWFIIFLGLLMLAGTIYIVFMSVRDSRNIGKKLVDLEVRRAELVSRFQELEGEIDGSNASNDQRIDIDDDKQFNLDVDDFKKMSESNKEAIETVPWHHWFSLSLFGLFANLIPVLLLIDTMLSEQRTSSVVFEVFGLLVAYKFLRRR